MTEQDPPTQAIKEFQQILSDGERWHDRALVAEQKLQQAEAAVAEMRACIEALREWEWDMPDHLVSACDISLSTSCGQGWLSPEAVEAKLSNYKITDAARQETIAALREKVHTLTGALETAQSKLDRYAIEHPAICYQCGAEVKKP